MNKKIFYLALVLLLVPACGPKNWKWGKTCPPCSTDYCETCPEYEASVSDSDSEVYSEEGGVNEDYDFDEDEDLDDFWGEEETDEMTQDITEDMNEDVMEDVSEEQVTETVALNKIYFNYNGKSVRQDQEIVLADNAERIRELVEDGYKVVVEGHSCNSAGSEDYNRRLSNERAQTIAAYLKDIGINEDSIEIVACGSEMPLVDGDREEQSPNRRVEIFAFRD